MRRRAFRNRANGIHMRIERKCVAANVPFPHEFRPKIFGRKASSGTFLHRCGFIPSRIELGPPLPSRRCLHPTDKYPLRGS
jgi:hypothetical protein